MTNTKLSILQIRSELKINGPGINVLDISSGMTKLGHKVVTASSGGSLINELDESGIKNYIIPGLSFESRSVINSIKSIIKLRKILVEEDIDIIHSHNLASGLLCKIASFTIKMDGIPNINTVHGTGKEKYLKIFSDKLITVADFKKEVLINNKVNPNKIVTIHNGINIENFNMETTSSSSFEDEFSIKKDEILVGIVAVMNNNKGYEFLIETVKHVTDRYDNVRYVFIGEGPLKETLLKRSAQLGIQNKIIFTGYRRDIPNILKRINILTLPSLREIFPISLLEGMAMGNAIIASSVGGIPEMIKDGVNGILVSPGNIEELTTAIIKLLSNPELRKSMGKRNGEDIKDIYNSEMMVGTMVEEYKKLLIKDF